MHNIATIWRKEMSSWFNGPVAYIVLLVFSAMSGFFFTSTFFLYDQSDLRALFLRLPVLLLFFVPAITMGLISREKHSGTVELLFTTPLSDSQIVAGKYLAALSLVAAALVSTGVSLLTLAVTGSDTDWGSVLCGYAGMLLMGALLSSIGIFTSSLTENQIVAFIICFLLSSVLYFIEDVLVLLPTAVNTILQYVSITYHMNGLARGVIDTRNLIYFGSGIIFFLALSVRILESRKWR